MLRTFGYWFSFVPACSTMPNLTWRSFAKRQDLVDAAVVEVDMKVHEREVELLIPWVCLGCLRDGAGKCRGGTGRQRGAHELTSRNASCGHHGEITPVSTDRRDPRGAGDGEVPGGSSRPQRRPITRIPRPARSLRVPSGVWLVSGSSFVRRIILTCQFIGTSIWGLVFHHPYGGPNP